MEQNQNERIREIEETIADLKKRWPAHSLKPAMYAELEKLEEELDELTRSDFSISDDL